MRAQQRLSKAEAVEEEQEGKYDQETSEDKRKPNRKTKKKDNKEYPKRAPHKRKTKVGSRTVPSSNMYCGNADQDPWKFDNKGEVFHDRKDNDSQVLRDTGDRFGCFISGVNLGKWQGANFKGGSGSGRK